MDDKILLFIGIITMIIGVIMMNFYNSRNDDSFSIITGRVVHAEIKGDMLFLEVVRNTTNKLIVYNYKGALPDKGSFVIAKTPKKNELIIAQDIIIR